MNLRFLTVIAAVLLLAACTETPQSTGGAGGNGAVMGQGGTSSGNVAAGSREDFIQNVGDRIFFAFDRSDISPEARETLEKQADWLKRYSNVTVTVEGNCDERGTREYNLALGQRRAEAAKKVLAALGVSSNRIQTISYGKERPAVVGSSEEAWAQNRRDVTVIN